MMERVEVTLEVGPLGFALVKTGYVSGLLEGVFVYSSFAEGTPALSVTALEAIGMVSSGRLILSTVVPGANADFYPRVPLVSYDNTPFEYADGFPVSERAPIYGILEILVSGAIEGDVFSVAIYLSNSNPNGR